MRSEMGSATVPVALFGVSPNRKDGRYQAPNGAARRLLPARRRDADRSGRDLSSLAVLRRVDDSAPYLQLHRSGLLLRFWGDFSACPASRPSVNRTRRCHKLNP